MANTTYDKLWQEAIVGLSEQLVLENPTAKVIQAADAASAFSHYKTLYVRYVQIYHQLLAASEGTVHAQKRLDQMDLLCGLAARVVQLRHALVAWHPLNPQLATTGADAGRAPFPWEYIAFDDDVLALKLQPGELELVSPTPLRDAMGKDVASRERLLAALQEGHPERATLLRELEAERCDPAAVCGGGASPLSPTSSSGRAVGVATTTTQCTAGAGLAAGGPKGTPSAPSTDNVSSGGASNNSTFTPSSQLAPPSWSVAPELRDAADAGACALQRLARGFLARRAVRRARINELAFLGMIRPLTYEAMGEADAVVASMRQAAQQRAHLRAANEAAYLAALPAVQEAVLREEGPGMRDRMHAHRTVWITSMLAAAKGEGGEPAAQQPLPEDLTGFYDALLQQAGAGTEGAAATTAAAPTPGKNTAATTTTSAPQKKDGEAAAAAAAKPGKAAAAVVPGAGGADGAAMAPPPLAGASPWTAALERHIRLYRTRWVGRNERDNIAQTHDDELARAVVRPAVEELIRREVDASILDVLANLRLLAGQAATGKAAKGGPGSKKGAGAKGKSGEGAGAVGKGAQPSTTAGKASIAAAKPLPGAKLCAGLTPRDVVEQLLEIGIVCRPRPASTFASFLGGMNLLSSRYAASDTPAQRHPVGGYWVPREPSLMEIRDALVAYAALPLLSPRLREEVSQYCALHALSGGRGPRSILLYGPSGTGKTHLVHAVANAAGALILDLSPAKLAARTPGADASTVLRLVHLAFEAARCGILGPCVLYIDDAERIVGGSGGAKKKTPAAGEAGGSQGGVVDAGRAAEEMASRLKKELPQYVASLSPRDAAIVIGSSKEPWLADSKALTAVFDKVLHVPQPDYPTRVLLWRERIRCLLTAGAAAAPPPQGSPKAGEGSSGSGGPVAAAAAAPRGGGSSRLREDAVERVAVAAATAAEALRFGALAQASSGYSAGAILAAAAEVLTPRRVHNLAHAPLHEDEFLEPLSRQRCVYAEDGELMAAFSDAVTGYASRRAAAAEAAAGAGGASASSAAASKKKGAKK